ncbi:MAG: hypothetical protein IT292_09250 [Deltaproteobacteria bacterium]|nr:hypothetical protein [Deltaproteobacteria bacterium]
MSEENSSWSSGSGESSFFASGNNGDKESAKPFQIFEGESIRLGGYLIMIVFILYPLIAMSLRLMRTDSKVNEHLSIENKVQQTQISRPTREVPQPQGLIGKLFCGGGLKRSSFCP